MLWQFNLSRQRGIILHRSLHSVDGNIRETVRENMPFSEDCLAEFPWRRQRRYYVVQMVTTGGVRIAPNGRLRMRAVRDF